MVRHTGEDFIDVEGMHGEFAIFFTESTSLRFSPGSEVQSGKLLAILRGAAADPESNSKTGSAYVRRFGIPQTPAKETRYIS